MQEIAVSFNFKQDNIHVLKCCLPTTEFSNEWKDERIVVKFSCITLNFLHISTWNFYRCNSKYTISLNLFISLINLIQIHTHMDEKDLRQVFQVDSHHEGKNTVLTVLNTLKNILTM